MSKFQISIDKEFQKLMKETVKSQKNPARSNEELIRRAVALYAYLDRQLAANKGAKIAILNNTETPIQIINSLP